jgi:hypothetical protein
VEVEVGVCLCKIKPNTSSNEEVGIGRPHREGLPAPHPVVTSLVMDAKCSGGGALRDY